MSDITIKLLLRNTLLGEYMGDEDYARHHFKEGKMRVDGSFWLSRYRALYEIIEVIRYETQKVLLRFSVLSH